MNKQFTLLFSILGFVLEMSAQTCTGGATRIGGIAFNDKNENGVKETVESQQANITVNVYNNAGTLVGSDVTDSNGDWFVNVPTAPSVSNKYRVQFSIPAALSAVGLQAALNGTGNRSDVQFVSAASCSVNFGVNYVGDYCNANPDLLVACFVSGDPLPVASTVKGEAAIVKVPYNVTGGTTSNPSPVAPSYIATVGDVGSIWGISYQRETKKLISSAMVKRHVGLGSAGLGGVYVTDMSTVTPTSALYFDLESFGYDLGQTVIASRTLPASGTASSADPTAFDAVGKIGLGGMDISEDGSKLYITDLYNKRLFIAHIGNPAKATITAADITTVNFPTPTCTNGVARPFALTYHKGKIYAGLVCTGESGGTIANVSASVYEFDPLSNTFNGTPILTQSMNYTKGAVHTTNNWLPYWRPWVSTFASLSTNGTVGTPATTRTGLPQPMLSDILFTDDGDMVLGFMDRAGHQTGYRQVNTAGTGNFSGYIGGDLIRAHYNGAAWVMENNGAVGSLTSAGGVGNGQGIGGGEFYYGDSYLTTHQETFMGGMVVVPNSNTLVATVMDPLNTWSAGFRWFSNTDGSTQKDYQVYSSQGSTSPNPATYGKANGLGVPRLACGAAPIEIGNYVWIDTDRDGVQDPNESPLPNVTVKLYKFVGGTSTLIASTSTDATGNYYFRDYQEFGVGFDTLTPNTKYFVAIGEGGQWSTAAKQLTVGGVDYVLTQQNTASAGDQADSDAFLYTTAGQPFSNYPVDTITIQNGGYVNHTLDFGLFFCPQITTPSVTQTICAGTPPSVLSVATNQNAASSIKFVRFSSDQIAGVTPTPTELANIYAAATTLGTVTPTGGASPYTASYTATAANFPNVTAANVTYYVYAILNPDLGADCRPVQEIQIIVKPTPTATATPASQTLCNGAMTTAVAFTSTVAGSTFSWTNNTTSIGLAASGTGNIGAFTTTNSGSTNVTATVSVTPSANGCAASTPQNFTITVKPAPSVSQPSNQTICNNANTTAINFTGSAVAGTTYSWTNNTTSIGLGASGAGNIAAFTAVNGTSSPIVATITVTPTANGCLGTARNFTITVNPTPSVTQPANLTYCNGASAPAIVFTGSAVAGTSYAWTNTVSSIGVDASGTNGHPSFAAINAGSTPVIANLTVTPIANTCVGTMRNFTITVNPTPSVTQPSNQTLCNNAMTSAITFAGSAVAATTYNWTNSRTSIGLIASGSGNIAAFMATNATASAVTSTITVTPIANTCAGTARNFTITVNPTPSVSDPSDQIVCHQTGTTAVSFGGSMVAGTTYSWTNDMPGVGLNASGSGNIAAFTALNITLSPRVATISVTPTANTCVGTPQSFTVTVNPSPAFATATTDPSVCGAMDGSFTLNSLQINTNYTVSYTFNGTPTSSVLMSNGTGSISIGSLSAGVYTNIVVQLGGCSTTPPANVTLTDPAAPTVDAVADITVCPNGTVAAIPFTGTGSPTFTWSNDNPSIGLAANGTGDIPTFAASNVATQQVAHITVTPSNGGCTGTAISFTVTVLKPTVDDPADVVVCSGSAVSAIPLSGSAGASFNWSNNNTATGLATSGMGDIAAFTAASVMAQTVSTVTVIPMISGCSGNTQAFTLTIDAPPTVTVPANLTVCSEGMVSALTFIPMQIGTTFNWTNNNTATGLAASGTGNNIAAFVSDAVAVATVSTITVTPTLNGCVGTPQIFTLTINPKPTALPEPEDAVYCAGGSVSPPVFTGTAGADFHWTNDNAATGLAASGIGDIATFTAAVVASQESSMIHVRPFKDGCFGNQELFTILTINPLPTVADPTDVVVCSEGTVAAIALSGTIGATFNWTNDNIATGLAASGTGNIASFTAHSSSVQEVSNITVTPRLNGCAGPPQYFTITVRPNPEVTAPTNVVACAGSTVPLMAFTGTASAAFNWTNNNTATGLVASGAGNIVPFMAANIASQQLSTITVTPMLNGCTGVPKMFDMTVYPLPVFTVTTQNPTTCGGTDGAMVLTGLLNNTTYMVSYTVAAVTTTAPFTSNGSGVITIGHLGSGTYSGVITDLNGCSSVAQSANLSDPGAPSVSAPSNQTVCGAGAVSAVVFSGTAGSSFYWTNNNTNIGLGASGLGNISAFNAAQVLTNHTATITVTPIKDGCFGTARTFDILVKANPVVNAVAPLFYCSGDAAAAIAFGSIPTSVGTTLTWTNDNTNTGLSGSGSGNIAAFTAATVTNLERSTIRVIPTLNGCVGNPSVILLNVNPQVSAGTAAVVPAICLNGTGLSIIDLESTLTGGNAGGTWTDVSAVSAGSHFNANDASLDPNGLAEGTYIFRFSVTGAAPCPNDAEDVRIIIERCCAPRICLPVAVARMN